MQLSGAAGVDESDPAFWIDSDPPRRHRSVVDHLPPIPSLADQLVHAAESLRLRSVAKRARGGVQSNKGCLTPDATPDILLVRLRKCGASGVSGQALWAWFHEQHPKVSRPAFYYAVGRLVDLGLITSTRGQRGVTSLRAVPA